MTDISDSANSQQNREARVIAYYLPQFHPIPENDEWWEEGFTEWTNVSKCRPLYPGHVQPKLPSELGFYDLRVPEARERQAQLAREYGIEGFCYWHYWFGNGRRLLELPFQEVLTSGQPTLPFCLAWANETWAGLLHGVKDPNRILMEQRYPGVNDFKDHFAAVEPALRDDRYIRVHGKPLFVVYKPDQLPNAREFISCWQTLAAERGLPAIHFVAVSNDADACLKQGFDAVVWNEPRRMIDRLPASVLDLVCKALLGRRAPDWKHKLLGYPHLYPYETLIEHARVDALDDYIYPCVVPNWDTCPRSGKHGIVFTGSSPMLFEKHLQAAVDNVSRRDPEDRIVFLKSWNEWAEGNFVEPDRTYGRQFLEAIGSVVLQPKTQLRSVSERA